MAYLPSSVVESTLSRILQGSLTRLHQGKVRDTYVLPDPDLLLMVATDRISVFDFVLPATVQNKGYVLTALTIFWLTHVLKGRGDHLIAYGSGIDGYLPGNLRQYVALQGRALIVRRKKITPIECIVRGYLTGSGWRSYKTTGQVCGIQLPPGLHDGSHLPEPIFTPTTKEETGHDQDLDASTISEDLRAKSLTLFQAASEFAQSRGIIIADTKFEFATDLTLVDEVLTPDSSRFWDHTEWEAAAARQKSPPPHDKEIVRQWAIQRGINSLNPTKPADLELVGSTVVPTDILHKTSHIYTAIFEALTSADLVTFTRDVMQI